MNSLRLRKIWKINETLLKRAREALPDPSPEIESEFRNLAIEFDQMIDHNEHEIALEMLEQMGLLVPARGGFWRDLERAAENMGLPDRIPFFRSEFDKALARINRKEQDSEGRINPASS